MDKPSWYHQQNKANNPFLAIQKSLMPCFHFSPPVRQLSVANTNSSVSLAWRIYAVQSVMAYSITFIFPVTTSLIKAVRYSVNKSISFLVLAFLASILLISDLINSTILSCSFVELGKTKKHPSKIFLTNIRLTCFPLVIKYLF